MKIVDRKGKLFGLINIIDLTVLIFLVSIIAVIMVFGYLTLINGGSIQAKKWVAVQIKFLGIYPEISGIISAGDVEKNPSGKTAAKLTSIVSINPSKAWVMVDNKTLSAIDDPVKKDIIVNVEVLCTETGGTFYYKANPLRIGNNVIFSTDLYTVSGVIIGVKRDGQQ